MSTPATVAIELDGRPGAIAAGDGAVWVIVDRGARDSRVARIDPAANRVAAVVPVTGQPFRIAAGDGAVWVAASVDESEDVVHRIDSATNRVVATLSLRGRYAGALAAGDGAAWMVLTERETRAGSLARIDTETNEVALTIPLDAGRARYAFDEIGLGHGAVWVLALDGLDGPGQVLRVDPATERVAARIPAEALNMGVGPGGVWITGCVDCDEYRDTYFAQEIDIRANASAGPRIAIEQVAFGPLVVGEDTPWFSGYAERGSRTVAFSLDPGTRAVERFLRIGDVLHRGMAFDAGRSALWVTRAVPPAVLRVDLGGNE